MHVWTAGPFKYMADRCGYTRTIEKAGAHLLTGSCPSTRGYPPGVRTAAYDSAKQRLSAAQETDARRFVSTEEADYFSSLYMETHLKKSPRMNPLAEAVADLTVWD